jgi:MFS family permease
VRRYRELLRVPGAARLVVSAWLGRLPWGIESLGLILLARQATGSYAVAGAVSAAYGLAVTVATPVQGRLMDRRGQRGVILACALGNAALLALLVAIVSTTPAVVIVACAGAAGLLVPPLSPALRALLPTLLAGRPALLDAGFALDAVSLELVFVAGPLVAAALSAAIDPAVAVGLGAVLSVAGSLAYASAPLARSWRGAVRAPGRLGPLAAPGLRTLLLAAVPQGVALGVLEVGLPAFADERGAAELGGLLLSGWAAGSLAGGLVYGGLRHRTPLRRRFLALAGLFPVGMLPTVLADGLGTMGVASVLAGVALAPMTITMYGLVDQVSPPGAIAEANAWLIGAIVGGFSIGAALAGRLVEGPGPSTGFAVGVALAAAGALVAVARRHTLAPLPSAV